MQTDTLVRNLLWQSDGEVVHEVLLGHPWKSQKNEENQFPVTFVQDLLRDLGHLLLKPVHHTCGHCTVINLQCTVYNVQFTIYSVQCTVYNVQ